MIRNLTLLAAALVATAIPSVAQYSVSGGGGYIPTVDADVSGGGGGNAGTVLPTDYTLFPLTMAVPAAATNIKSVALTGLEHTWAGDLQIVLWEPTMTTGYNLLARHGITSTTANCCGSSGNFGLVGVGANYTFLPAGDPGITGTWPAATFSTDLPAGSYAQYPNVWVSGSAGVVNLDLASIPVVPGTWVLAIYDGAGGDDGSLISWTLSGDTGPSSTPICFGDGSGTACPCANSGAPGNGCASSVNAAGGNLAASGVASIAGDTLVLNGTGMPNSSCLYFQGSATIAAGAGSAFGDGLRCAGGSVIRLGTKTNVSGASQYPDVGDLSVSVRGLNAAGNFRVYQAWYRNAAAFCTPSTFNLTNAVSLTWAP